GQLTIGVIAKLVKFSQVRRRLPSLPGPTALSISLERRGPFLPLGNLSRDAPHESGHAVPQFRRPYSVRHERGGTADESRRRRLGLRHAQGHPVDRPLTPPLSSLVATSGLACGLSNQPTSEAACGYERLYNDLSRLPPDARTLTGGTQMKRRLTLLSLLCG